MTEPLERRRLIGLAYRMLGSFAEAEDVVQDALVRFQAVDSERVHDRGNYLSKTVARLCLDRLKSARARREQYFGTWLPEPLVETTAVSPERALELADDVSFALMLLLERLSPPERTSFLLHDVFGMDFDSVGEILERSAAACRKLADRAREQVLAERPRFAASAEEEQRLVREFMHAATTGDVSALAQLLAEDAVLYADGGGRGHAAPKPIYGQDRIVRFVAGVQRHPKYSAPVAIEQCRVNQSPGYLMRHADGSVAVAAFQITLGRIQCVYVITNPGKLQHVRCP